MTRSLLALLTVLPFASAVQAQPGAARNLIYATNQAANQSLPSVAAFNSWANRFVAAPNLTDRSSMVSEGLSLARRRRAELAQLIKTAPEQALAMAVPAEIRQQLPAELIAELETRISGIGELSVLGVLASKEGPPVQPVQRYVRLNDVTYSAFVYGRRSSQTSKQGIPLHGIALDGLVAVHEGSLRELEVGEVPDPAKPITELGGSNPQSGILAEAGGALYRFASQADLQAAEARLEAAEAGLVPVPARPADLVIRANLKDGGPPPPPPTAWTTGLKKVLVIRVDFSDLAGDPTDIATGNPLTQAYVQGISDTQVAPYYPKSSYGLTSLNFTVSTNLYRLPQTAVFYATDPSGNGQLHTDAEAAAAADFQVASYDRIVVVFAFLAQIPGSFITYGGLAQVVGKNVWINGEYDFRVVAHELGHTYGLYHAGFWQVSDGNPISPTGSTIEYGDDFDTMGANYANDLSTDFNPYYKNILGWIADSQVQTSAHDGTYRLYTFDWGNFVSAPTNHTLALKFVKDSARTYWIGVRRNFTGNPFMQNGVYVFWGLNSFPAGAASLSQLLDMNTPGLAPFIGVNNDYDSSLSIGQTFNDSAAGFQVVPVATGGTAPNEYVDIQVGNGGLGLVLLTNYVSGGNGNGSIDPNECNNLDLPVANFGLADATGVSGTLSTTTPGVIVVQRTSSYPFLPVNGVATNQTPFKVSTSPAFVCGTPIDFTLFVKSDQTTTVSRFRLVTGSPGTPVRFDNNNPVPIFGTETNGVSSPMFVSGITSAVSKVTVSLHVTYPFESGLALQLISPGGQSNTLYALNQPNGNSQNFGFACSPDSARTTFDDAASTPIGSGFSPFVGSFQPSEPLAVFNGLAGTNVNGMWQLHAVEEFTGLTGSIDCWSLAISSPICSDGGGQCPGVDLVLGITSAPNPVFVGSNLVYTISVTNRGPNTAHGVAVSQFLPPSMTYVFGSASQGSVLFSGGTVSASLGTLDVGAVATVTVRTIATTNGFFNSTASVNAIETDVDNSNNSATCVTLVNPDTADLSVSIFDSPDPVLAGGVLTYTLTVNNNGPSVARFVAVTNVLPTTVSVMGAASAQGTFLFAGNVIIWNLTDPLTSGNHATATIQVIPNVDGTISTTATASSQQVDPRLANNTATAVTTVSPSADVGLGITDFPDPVIVRSNLTYSINVTNFGPSTATGVLVNDILPAGVKVVGTNATQGSVAVFGSTVLANLGTMPRSAVATVTIVVTATNAGTISNSATVSATQSDPNSTNNTATITTVVAAPFLNMSAAGTKLTAESFTPLNGTVDVGETVTCIFYLRNTGNVNNTNLVGTLLATGGVTAPSGPRTYGVLQPSGQPVGQPFTFTAAGTNGGTVTATLQLKDGGILLTNAIYTFALPNVSSFAAGTNIIVIPDSGMAIPYPATVTVSGITGQVGKVTATLSDFSHSYPHDVSALLVGPTGARVILMSHAGEFSTESHVDLTFDDSGVSPLPPSGSFSSGSWQPSAYAPAVTFSNPAPAGPYSSTMSVFTGVNPNGQWSLYIIDDSTGDSGGISNGWSVAVTTISPVNQPADLGVSVTAAPNPLKVADTLTYTFIVTNNGPGNATAVTFSNALPASVGLFSAVPSQGTATTNGGIVVASLGSLASGSGATVTIQVSPLVAGPLTNTASVTAAEADSHPADNVVSVVTTVLQPLADLVLRQVASSTTVLVGSNLTFTTSVTNNGPERAASVVVTDVLPPGFGAGTTSLPGGSWSNVGGTLTCNLGVLNVGAGVSFTITATATAAGAGTNVASVATISNDTNAPNNSVTTVLTMITPAPIISAVGATMVSEGFSPPNGVIDPGEQVTLAFALANVGSQDTINLRATLLASGGVVSPSGPQSYGVMVHGGPSVSHNFTFTAGAPAGGTILGTLQLKDERGSVTNNLGTAVFTFNLPAANTFVNTNGINIPDHGPGTPYPSIITISGLPGIVGKATVTLNGLTHSFPRDVNVLLVNPAGGNVKLMSHTGGAHAFNSPVTLTFDDSAPVFLPNSGVITNGTYKPTSLGSVTFQFPAPPAPYGSAMSDLNNVSPNGTWSLYVLDDAPGDSGRIANGWTLSLATISPLNPIADRLTIVQMINGQLLLTLTGLSSHGYIIQSSSDLQTWTPVLSGTTAPNGTLQFMLDAESTGAVYYRSLRNP